MPLTTMARQLDGVPAEVLDACRQLRFRNTILVYLEVLNENPFTDNWIYVHSAELQFGRVTNFRNWVPQLYGESPHAILALDTGATRMTNSGNMVTQNWWPRLNRKL